MICVKKTDAWELWKYNPGVFKPFMINMEPLSLLARIRFLIDYCYGYEVFYIKKQDTYIGYCTLTSGKNPRYWFANGDDIIIGPYYVDEKYRGQGFCRSMVQASLYATASEWNNAYLYIKNTNMPSIKVALSIGAEWVFNVHNTVTRKLVKDDAGEYGVYRVSRQR